MVLNPSTGHPCGYPYDVRIIENPAFVYSWITDNNDNTFTVSGGDRQTESGAVNYSITVNTYNEYGVLHSTQNHNIPFTATDPCDTAEVYSTGGSAMVPTLEVAVTQVASQGYLEF